jgi:hypothetical protein
MGQGIIGYTTDAESLGARAGRTGFTIDSDQLLKFNEANFYACPANIDSYVLWADVGTSTPGHQDGCLKVAIQGAFEAEPVRCKYTPSQ